MNIHAVSLKGRRDENEDKHNYIINKNGKNKNFAKVNFLGVYDGHGGKFVSKFLSKFLPDKFVHKSITYPVSPEYINTTYETLNNILFTKYEKEATNCGATCLVVLHYKNIQEKINYMHVLNTGDSRAVLCKNNIAITLTKDHKPNWPEEKARIEKLNGKIYYDGDDYRIKDLSVSRAFGDKSAHPFVICTPDIMTYKLDNTDKFIVLACDGLWDVLSCQEVVNFILIECYENADKRIKKEINIAKKLGEYAIQKGSSDNITILVGFID
jgi:serine/threonine protein phosphatase PrpC